jgi:transcriptional regulator with XRE-family HTH domain
MKPIEQLRNYVKTKHPEAAMTVTPPLIQEGVWFIEIICGNQRLIIQWSFATGFGICSLPSESYGESPDETYKSLKVVQRRITELLTSNERATPPIGVLLSRLREQRGYTQELLASKLGVSQATISGIERRSDIQLSTLRKIVEVLGWSLKISDPLSDTIYRLAPNSIIQAQEHAQSSTSPSIDLLVPQGANPSSVSPDAAESNFESLGGYRAGEHLGMSSNGLTPPHVPRMTTGRAGD